MLCQIFLNSYILEGQDMTSDNDKCEGMTFFFIWQKYYFDMRRPIQKKITPQI